MQSLLEQLQELPDSWGLVAVDGNKRAYQTGWQHNPLSKAQAAAEIKAGRAKAIGVIAGPTSDGILFVDHDGISATGELEKLGLPIRSLPKSLATTSGRDGRFQLIYKVPEDYWPALRNRRVFKTGANDSEGKAENLDLRWNGHYSVVIGAHPKTTGYRWLNGRGPQDQTLAEAPTQLIELLLTKQQENTDNQLTITNQPSLVGSQVPFLDFICKESRELVESGGTPGCWNDDQLRLALDLRGTYTWLRDQGARPDITAEEAFAQHISAARTKASDFDERKAWHRFEGANALNPQPSTPEHKLIDRLRFHTRSERRVLPEPPQKQQVTAANSPPQMGKPIKLEAIELLAFLRQQAASSDLRYNTFTQQIELNGSVMDGAERFYLQLADQGFKVSKELALDCLVQVARENPYDPVRLYLEHVEATVAPTYIGGLASAYLRPSEVPEGAEATIYDHMLRCTLIGAVRRVFEPGCKHDTACVLMGDQGARKSSFWSALAGPFFSDALGDISSKDDLMVLHRSWIMEWAELDHIVGRKHAGQVKSFLSQSTDLFRVPYGKAAEAFPRRGIIVGSTNRETGFLVDDTGNRRFWVIPTTCTEESPIDTATLMLERDAIWAAAVHAYRAGDASFLPSQLAERVTEENEAYQIDNPWKEPISAWLRAARNSGKVVTGELLLSEAIQKPTERQNKADLMQISIVMRDLGFKKTRKRIDGVPKWVYT